MIIRKFFCRLKYGCSLILKLILIHIIDVFTLIIVLKENYGSNVTEKDIILFCMYIFKKDPRRTVQSNMVW